MPTKEQHIKKADRNAQFAIDLTLSSKASIDWALISLFYGAMHYVEAYLDVTYAGSRVQHLKSHITRDSLVGTDTKLKKIFREYQDLKYFGFNARYEMVDFDVKDVQAAAIPEFNKIKAYITGLLPIT